MSSLPADTADTLVLLGAGASAEAGVPTSFEMTEQIVKLIEQDHFDDRLAHALHFVCGQLIADQATGGASPYDGVDVERVFSAVELLSERNKLEVTPFVSAWHPAVDTWGSPPLPMQFDSDLQQALFGPFSGNPRARDLIVKLIQTVTGNSETGRIYDRLAERMIHQLRSLLATEVGALDYLAPLLSLAAQPAGLTIATLNYDLSIEQLAADRGVSLSTGIESWASDRPWEWGDAAIRLLKLHGSIDWSWEYAEKVPGHMTYRTVRQASVGALDDNQPPVVVFGQRGKMRAAGPFLSLVTELEKQLASVQRLLVIGYSFRDDHVNEIIRRWTRGDLARTAMVVDPNFPDNYSGSPFRRELLEGLAPWRPPNVEAEPARMTVQRSKASEALADLFPPQ